MQRHTNKYRNTDKHYTNTGIYTHRNRLSQTETGIGTQATSRYQQGGYIVRDHMKRITDRQTSGDRQRQTQRETASR